MFGMYGRYGMYGMNGWYCMDGRYGMEVCWVRPKGSMYLVNARLVVRNAAKT